LGGKKNTKVESSVRELKKKTNFIKETKDKRETCTQVHKEHHGGATYFLHAI